MDKINKDLEKAAYKYTNSEASRSVGRAWLQRDVRLAYIAGWNAHKEQMLKDAMDTTMVEGSIDNPTFVRRKIIIVKED